MLSKCNEANFQNYVGLRYVALIWALTEGEF